MLHDIPPPLLRLRSRRIGAGSPVRPRLGSRDGKAAAAGTGVSVSVSVAFTIVAQTGRLIPRLSLFVYLASLISKLTVDHLPIPIVYIQSARYFIDFEGRMTVTARLTSYPFTFSPSEYKCFIKTFTHIEQESFQ